MVCKKRGAYGFLGTSWVLITMHPRNSGGTVYSRGNRTPESDKKQTSVYVIKRIMKKKISYMYQVRIYPLM